MTQLTDILTGPIGWAVFAAFAFWGALDFPWPHAVTSWHLGDFADPANWSSGGPPRAGDTLVFPPSPRTLEWTGGKPEPPKDVLISEKRLSDATRDAIKDAWRMPPAVPMERQEYVNGKPKGDTAVVKLTPEQLLVQKMKDEGWPAPMPLLDLEEFRRRTKRDGFLTAEDYRELARCGI